MLRPREGTRAYLGVGSNLGDRARHLRAAAIELQARQVWLVRASGLYASRYVGPGGAQPEYLNAVLEVRTQMAPRPLLAVTQAVERLHGRRPDSHMQPRPLDIDILAYGSLVIAEDDLIVPHPRLSQRLFVLLPLQELAALQHVPVDGLAERLRRLQADQRQEQQPLEQQQVWRVADWDAAEDERGLRA